MRVPRIPPGRAAALRAALLTLVALAARPPATPAQIPTTVRIDSVGPGAGDTSATRVTVSIQHPDVAHPWQPFPQVALLPGDRWTVEAEGCVQTGGSGRTWKRYVNPIGPHTDRLYHSLVRVSANDPPRRLLEVNGREQVVPTSANPASLQFTLGYVDDDYRDNGYNGHDNGTDDQCLSQPDAHLTLTIVRARRAVVAMLRSRVARAAGIAPQTATLTAVPIDRPSATTTVKAGGDTILRAIKIGAYNDIGPSRAARAPASAPTAAPRPAPTPAAAGSPDYELYVLADSSGMRRPPGEKAYVGTLWFAIVDRSRASTSTPLSSPVSVQLSADGGLVVPNEPKVTETMRRVAVTVSTRRWTPKVRVHIVPLGLTRPADVDLLVRREPLTIVLDDTMPRFGLGRADVTVGLPMEAAEDSVNIALTQTNGSVAPTNLWVKPNAPGKATFWSGVPARGQIRAVTVNNSYAEASREVAYVWPVGFLGATLIGALAGAVGIMVFRNRSLTEVPVVVAGAVVSGAIVAVLGSVIGVRVGALDPAVGGGLALTFLFAVLGAWLGVKAFDFISGTKSERGAH